MILSPLCQDSHSHFCLLPPFTLNNCSKCLAGQAAINVIALWGDLRVQRGEESPDLREVAPISLAREESQETCRKRLNRCKGLWGQRWKPEVSDLPLSLPSLPGLLWKLRVISRELLSPNCSLVGASYRWCLSGSWEVTQWKSTFNKNFNIFNSSYWFLVLENCLRVDTFFFSPVLVSSAPSLPSPFRLGGRRCEGL